MNDTQAAKTVLQEYEKGVEYFETNDTDGCINLFRSLDSLGLGFDTAFKVHCELLKREKGVRKLFGSSVEGAFKNMILDRSYLGGGLKSLEDVVDIYESYEEIDNLKLPSLRSLINYTVSYIIHKNERDVHSTLYWLCSNADDTFKKYPRLVNWLTCLLSIYSTNNFCDVFSGYSVNPLSNTEWSQENMRKMRNFLKFNGYHLEKCDLAVSVFIESKNEADLAQYMYLKASYIVEGGRHGVSTRYADYLMAYIVLKFCRPYLTDKKKWCTMYIYDCLANVAKYKMETLGVGSRRVKSSQYFFKSANVAKQALNMESRAIKRISKGYRALEYSYDFEDYSSRSQLHRNAILQMMRLADDSKDDNTSDVIQDTIRVHKVLISRARAQEAASNEEWEKCLEKAENAFSMVKNIGFHLHLPRLEETQKEAIDALGE